MKHRCLNIDEICDVLGTSVKGTLPLTESLAQDACFSSIPIVAPFELGLMLEILSVGHRNIVVGYRNGPLRTYLGRRPARLSLNRIVNHLLSFLSLLDLNPALFVVNVA